METYLTLKNVSALLLSVAASSVGHVLLKVGMSRSEGLNSRSIPAMLYELAVNSWLLAGLALHISALFLWLYALKRVDLTLAYPFLALGYVAVFGMCVIWLGEVFTGTKLLGTVLIVAGVWIIGHSEQI